VADGKWYNGKNKPLTVNQTDSIEIWTNAFINNANVMID
jgi:hypothetical protein